MPDLTNILDQIDRLDQEATSGPWVANDRGIGYEITTQQQVEEAAAVDEWPLPINSGIRDTFQRSDAEFIALARSALPALSKALRAVLEIHKPFHADYYYNGMNGESLHRFIPRCEGCDDTGGIEEYPCPTVQAITDVFEDVADRQAFDQARAEDDGKRISLDEYLEARDD